MSEPSEIEARAQRMGWVPKEQFRGSEEKFIDAETFVKRGEDELPILRERNRALDDRYKKLEREFREVKETLSEFAEHHRNVSTREYNRAMSDLKRQQKEAVSLGNTQKFDEISGEIEELEKVKPTDKPDKKEEKLTSEQKSDREHYETFCEENSFWWGKDRAMTAYARECANDIEREHPELLGSPKFYPKVLKMVQEEFPHKFENQRRKEPGAVHGGGEEGPRGKGGKKGYSDLPAEAKVACDKFVRTIPGYTKEQYVKDYFGGEA